MSGTLLISVSVSFVFFFLGFVLFCLEHILWSSILLDFVCFYKLGWTATFPKLEGMVLCVIIPCVDCVCLVTLAGWA